MFKLMFNFQTFLYTKGNLNFKTQTNIKVIDWHFSEELIEKLEAKNKLAIHNQKQKKKFLRAKTEHIEAKAKSVNTAEKKTQYIVISFFTIVLCEQ